jgi:hypothetical protein
MHLPKVLRMEEKQARLTVLIDPQNKEAFEVLCSSKELTSSQVVRQLILEYLARHGVSYPAEDEKKRRQSR